MYVSVCVHVNLKHTFINIYQISFKVFILKIDFDLSI